MISFNEFTIGVCALAFVFDMLLACTYSHKENVSRASYHAIWCVVDVLLLMFFGGAR